MSTLFGGQQLTQPSLFNTSFNSASIQATTTTTESTKSTTATTATTATITATASPNSATTTTTTSLVTKSEKRTIPNHLVLKETKFPTRHH